MYRKKLTIEEQILDMQKKVLPFSLQILKPLIPF